MSVLSKSLRARTALLVAGAVVRKAPVDTGVLHGPELPDDGDRWAGLVPYSCHVLTCTCGAVDTRMPHVWHRTNCPWWGSRFAWWGYFETRKVGA